MGGGGSVCLGSGGGGSLAIEVDAIHERHWHTGLGSMVWIDVWNRKCKWNGIPVLPLFLWRVNLL